MFFACGAIAYSFRFDLQSVQSCCLEAFLFSEFQSFIYFLKQFKVIIDLFTQRKLEDTCIETCSSICTASVTSVAHQ